MPLPPTFEARLISGRALAPQVRELTFERLDGPLRFDPGQWVNLLLPPELALLHRGSPPGAAPPGELRRAYSIASPPDGSARFSIAVTRVLGGPGSSALHALAPGARIQAIGPQGFFVRKPGDGRPSLFVGTGTGVTPLRSMLLAAVAAGAGEPLWLLLGVRHELDFLYRDELERLARVYPTVRVLCTLSRPPPGWPSLSGYVQAHVPALFAELGRASAAAPHLYVCGLERMVKAVREVARKELGVARDHVHSERYD